MISLRQLLSTTLSLAILCGSAAAQTAANNTQSPADAKSADAKPADVKSSAPAVTASISETGVRFAAPGEVLQVRLQIYAAAGDVVFDSGARSGGVIDWKAADVPQGLADGAYLCVVTVKDLHNQQTQKLAALSVEAGKVSLAGAKENELTAAQTKLVASARAALKVEPTEVAGALTVMREGRERAVTVASHDGRVGAVTSTTGGLSFRTGDFFAGTEVERMRLTPEGRVGIGTTDPQATLDVAGTVRARGGIIFDDGTILKSAQGASRLAAATVGGGDIPTPNVAGTGTTGRFPKWLDNAGTLGDSVVSEANGNLVVNGGNIQMTANPSPSVDSNILFMDSNSKTAGFIASATPAFSANNGSYVAMRGNTYSIYPNQRGLISISAGNVPAPTGRDGSILFMTGNDQLRLLVNPLGNVGIGTDTPTAKLDVAGNLRLSAPGSALFFPDGTSMTTAAVGGGGGGAMTGTSIVNAINDAATVGVIADNRHSTNIARLNAQNAWTSNQSVTGNVTASGGVTSSTLTVDTNTLSVNAVTHRVGVGTVSPEQSLSVNGALSIDQGNLNSGILAPGLTFGSQSGEGIASKRTAGSNQFGLDFYTDFVNRMSITNGGRVGIGTNTPAARLDILGGANSNGAVDPYAMAFQWNGGGYRHWIRTRHNAILGSGNAIDFFVNNSTTSTGSSAPSVGTLHVMTLDSGRVGVGNMTPTYKLHVSDTGNTGLRVENGVAGGTVASFGGNGDFSIDTAATIGGRMIVKENGNVGIGTNNPGSKLTVVGETNVNGNITATGSVVGDSLFVKNVVSATGFRFGDGTEQTSAAGTAYISYRNISVQLPQVGQSAASIEHLDLPAGNYEITATFVLENEANIAFQDNTRQVTCTLVNDSNTLTMMAPSSGVYSYNTVTLHTVKPFAQATGIDLSCKVNTGGTDRSYVYVYQRRVTALKLGDNVVVQP